MKPSEINRKIRQIKSWRPFIIMTVGLTLGVIIDAIVKVTGKSLIYVSEDYLNEVFGASCTVAVLGNAMLSLLFGSSEKVIRGVQFQDILHSTKFGSDQWMTIVVTTISILCAICAYTFELYSTLTIIVCMDALLILSSSLDLWKLLSSEEEQKKIINEIIYEVPPARLDVYVDNWFHELELSLNANYEAAVQEFSELIEKLTATTSDEDHPLNATIAKCLPDFFGVACEKVGFPNAYKLFKQINHIRPDGFVDCEITAIDYIKSLKYNEDINIHNRNIPVIVEEIIEKMESSSWEKVSFTYQYFCAIFDNVYFSSEIRDDLLRGIMDVLCDIRDRNEGEIKKEVILLIVKYDILLNENKDNRKHLFHMLSEYLLRKNRYTDDQSFISTTAEIFQAFFFFIYRERETLTEDYRNSLIELFHSKPSQKDSVEATFTRLVMENSEKITACLAVIAAKFDRRRRLFWDYFSPTVGFKSIVWSAPELIRFAFCFFKVIGYTHYGHPFVQILESDEYTKDEKISVCRVIANLYDQGELNGTALDTITQIEEFTGICGHKGDYIDHQEHNYFQDMLSELTIGGNEGTEEQQVLTNLEMQQLVHQELSKGNVFEHDPTLQLKPATRRRIEPSLVEINEHQSKQSAYRIAQLLKIIMNDVIARKLSEVSVDFGLDGVRNLISMLDDKKWQYRNYKHVNDYAIPITVRETDEFKRLCEILDEIDYDGSHEIASYVFLKNPKLQYNLDIHYHLENPTEEKCVEFVNRHRIADGVYQIGANRFDYAHAIRYVRKKYQLEIVDLFVRVAIDRESGFRVEFKRNK